MLAAPKGRSLPEQPIDARSSAMAADLIPFELIRRESSDG